VTWHPTFIPADAPPARLALLRLQRELGLRAAAQAALYGATADYNWGVIPEARNYEHEQILSPHSVPPCCLAPRPRSRPATSPLNSPNLAMSFLPDLRRKRTLVRTLLAGEKQEAGSTRRWDGWIGSAGRVAAGKYQWRLFTSAGLKASICWALGHEPGWPRMTDGIGNHGGRRLLRWIPRATYTAAQSSGEGHRFCRRCRWDGNINSGRRAI